MLTKTIFSTWMKQILKNLTLITTRDMCSRKIKTEISPRSTFKTLAMLTRKIFFLALKSATSKFKLK